MTRSWSPRRRPGSTEHTPTSEQLITNGPPDPPLLEDIVFHAQQAVEKSFKGFLAWHGVTFRKTHNLEELAGSCLRIDPTLKTLADEAVPLTEYAWRFRYPGEPESPSREEAAAALETAREVYEALLARLPGEVRP